MNRLIHTGLLIAALLGGMTLGAAQAGTPLEQLAALEKAAGAWPKAVHPAARP